MRKVDLRMFEQNKYDVIKKLVNTNGNKKNAALKLGCTTRTINRLIKLYLEEGKQGFIHKNRGRKPACAFSSDLKSKIISLYMNEYTDTNFTHFCEIIKEDLNVSISPTTLKSWLSEQYVLSPKAKRSTKKQMKITLQQLHDSFINYS